MPAFAAAAAGLGRELTVPSIAQSVVLTRMPGRASRMPERESLKTFAASGATLAIHLAIHAIDTIVAELIPQYGADCPVAVVMRASWPDERVLRGTLETIRALLSAEPMERTTLYSWAARWRLPILMRAPSTSRLPAAISQCQCCLIASRPLRPPPRTDREPRH